MDSAAEGAKVSLGNIGFEEESNIAGGGGRADLIKTKEGQDVASITLADCLACSGCVTSAETVLIQ
jgi:iron only hydrogenase large subunit-like protein